jgi:hypothetical protein
VSVTKTEVYTILRDVCIVSNRLTYIYVRWKYWRNRCAGHRSHSTRQCLPLYVTQKGCRSEFQNPPIKSFTSKIQGGNFNWYKIHNLEIGHFCKKYRNRSIFLFLCPHFDAYGFCISAPGRAQPPPTFFFKRKGISSDTSFERPICKEYNALFVS